MWLLSMWKDEAGDVSVKVPGIENCLVLTRRHDDISKFLEIWRDFFWGGLEYAKTGLRVLCLWLCALLSILIIVQRDATQSSLFIILQIHFTCFGCQPHPSSGVHKTVTTASGTGCIFYAPTYLQHGQPWPRWREVAAQYRKLYSWWWVWLTPETCRVNLQNNK